MPCYIWMATSEMNSHAISLNRLHTMDWIAHYPPGNACIRRLSRYRLTRYPLPYSTTLENFEGADFPIITWWKNYVGKEVAM